MSEPNGHICPECSTPRASDGTPSCACGRRASEALLEARTAEAAAAEDFDPLRIRPYVELGDENEHPGSAGAAGNDEALTIQRGRVEPETGPADPGTSGPDHTPTIAMPVTTAATATRPNAADVRMFEQLEAETGEDGPGTSPSGELFPTRQSPTSPYAPPSPYSSSTSPASPASVPSVPSPLAGGPSVPASPSALGSTSTTPEPTSMALGPFASPASSGPSASPASPSARHPRRRRRHRTGIVVTLAGTAAAGVMAAAGIASGLFSYDAPERNRALPDDVRASAPDTSPDGEASPVEPSGAGGAPAAAPSSDAPPPSTTKSPSSSPSPARSSGSPSASASATPTQSTPSPSASGGSSAADAEGPDDSRLAVPKTLRLGDNDPEVTQLQLRLRQLGLYNGDIDENYDSQVEQAVIFYQNSRGITKDKEEPGVYGLATRERLESETKKP